MTTTLDRRATSVDEPRAGMAGDTLRRWACGLALVLYPGLLVLQALVAPDDGSGEAMFASAVDDRAALLASGVLLIASGALMAPAAVGILREVRGRGAALANVAAVVAVLGGTGHIGLGYFSAVTAALAGGDRAEMVAFVDRIGADAGIMAFVAPLLTCFGLALVLLPWAANRAGLIGRWAPLVSLAALLGHYATPPDFPGQALITVVILGVVTVVHARLARIVLARRHA